MSRTLVTDASAVVAMLTSVDERAEWVRRTLADATTLIAPDHLPVEVANALRGLQAGRHLTAAEASLAHQDLLSLRIELWPYAAVAERAWELGARLSAYDATYLALAELVDAPLCTLDARLAKTRGVAVRWLTPQSRGS